MTKRELLEAVLELAHKAHESDEIRIGNALLNICRVAQLPRPVMVEASLAGDCIVNAIELRAK